MNMMQRHVAVAVREHFIRQNAAMHRDGPVARINEDQDQLLAELVNIFKQQNPQFDAGEFLHVALP